MRSRPTPWWLILFGLVWLNLAAQPARSDAGKRVALLIGNSDYGDGKPVSGRADAAAIEHQLELLGFTGTDVVTVPDANLAQMNAAIKNFQDRMKEASVVVFFFSGHGFHRGDESYLIPKDGSTSSGRAIPLKNVLKSFDFAPDALVKLVILNACRTKIGSGDDPQDPEKPEQGMAPPQGSAWRVVQAFATSPGLDTNSGKDDELSPFVQALSDHLLEPGIDLQELFSAVREDVIRSTSNSNGRYNPQFPVAYGLEDGQDFVLSPPARVEATVELADDDLIVFLNGKLALNHQTQGVVAKKDSLQKYLELKSGTNELTVLVSNQKTLRNGLAWERANGWGYKLQLTGPNGEKLSSPECGGQDPCFSGGEDIPFKNGPHHGKTFVVATANLYVDPTSGMSPRVSLKDVKNDLWKNSEDSEIGGKVPFWAKDQELLYAVSLTKLPLGVAVAGNLQEVFDMIVKNVLEVEKNIPDPNKIYNVVRGNAALREFVAPCIEGPAYCDDRMKDFKEGIDAARKGVSKPFDGFVEKLTECIRQRAAQKPGFTIPAEDILVSTAFEDWTSEPNQPPNPGFSGDPSCLAGLSSRGALAETPTHGFRIGPRPFAAAIRGVPLTFNASAFVNLKPQNKGQFLLSARVVADLSDLQRKLNAIIDTIPLPSDTCARFADDNLVASITSRQITVEGEVATLRLNGDLEVWKCMKNPLYPACKFLGCDEAMKTKLEATLSLQVPVRSVVTGANAVTFKMDEPQVEVRGKSEIDRLAEGFLRAVGVDIEGKVKEALKRTIEPDLFTAPLPAELQRFNPTLTRAGFFDNAGILATSLEMTASINDYDLLGLIKLFTPAVGGKP